MSFIPETLKAAFQIDKRAHQKPHDKMPDKYRLSHPEHSTTDPHNEETHTSPGERFASAPQRPNSRPFGGGMQSVASILRGKKRSRFPMAVFLGACLFLTSGVITYGQNQAATDAQYYNGGSATYSDPCLAQNGSTAQNTNSTTNGAYYTDPRTGEQYYRNGQSANGSSNSSNYDQQNYNSSNTNAQFASDYRVETNRREVVAGEPVTVEWETPNDPSGRSNNGSDWVGTYRAGDSDRQYKDWEYTKGQQSGTTVFVFTEPGTYEIRYYQNGYERRATSETVQVRDQNTNGTQNQNQQNSQQQQTATRTDTSNTQQNNQNTNNNDRFDPQTQGDGYYDQKNTAEQRNGNTNSDQQSATQASGGTYEVRPSRTTVITGETVHVNWIAPKGEASSRDWIGTYRAGDSDRQYKDWEYTKGQQSGTTVFVFTEPGTYEIRYYKDNGYERQAVSQRVEVRER